jgi:DNA-binding NarL/FixJ family response regulator
MRDLSALDQLTPHEQHIAGLVADGPTNADIAAVVSQSSEPPTTTCTKCSPT